MTSKLTRDRLQEIAEDGFLKHGESKELARTVLAVLDSEPVAEVLSNRPGNDTSTIDRALPVGTQLYRHAQTAPAFPDFDNVLESLDYEVRCNAWESEHVLKACQATYDACRAAMLNGGKS
ncbi:hypothetical protein [Klebsiella pneumoniae]|uniref:hypothetical protein n=1 Tax=Klebsiella pneumoniae TaxID=573 RepID=UPI0022476FE6|nr:hypothetical protein [Klebsiella pneumoniae]MCW9304130.1 hypothetical protein [Klebsiella pneumoniae]